jgi:predicted RNA-binding Zn-ribbon protein involved in translation (DUF1610 family)
MKNQKNKTQTIKFTCPDCGCKAIREVIINVTMFAQLKAIKGKGELEYRHLNLQEGKTVRFECAECGYVIKDENGRAITTQADFIKWVRRQEQLN